MFLNMQVYAQRSNTMNSKKNATSLELYNLYQLSKYIDTNSYTNLDSEEQINILEYLMHLNDSSRITALTKKTESFAAIFYAFKNNTKIDDLIFEKIHKNSKQLNQKRNSTIDCINSLNLEKDILKKVNTTILDLKKQLEIVKNSGNSNINCDPLLKIIYDSLHIYKNSYPINGRLSDTIRIENVDTLLSEFPGIINELLENNKSYVVSHLLNLKKLNDSISKTVNPKSKELKFIHLSYDHLIQTQEANIAQAEQRVSSTSFKMPSESEVIEAMAIFLANRTKQEAIIWFLDQVRVQSKNPLIADAFPTVLQLLNNISDYKIPSFGNEWRYAISKDLISLPKHIINSEWVRYNFKNDSSNISTLVLGIQFANDLHNLINQNYSYRDIIRHFYINSKDTQDDNLNNKISKSVKLLYIITNELFILDELPNEVSKFRLLTYEEIMSMSATRFENFLYLVKQKYNIDDSIIKKLSDEKKIKPLIGKILISLAQFDKIYAHLKTSTQDKSTLTSQTIWNIMNQTIDAIATLDSAIFNQKDNHHAKKYFPIIKDCLGIYESVIRKDFNQLTSKTLDLLTKFQRINNNDTITIKTHNSKNLKIIIIEDTNKHHVSMNIDKLTISTINDSILITTNDYGNFSIHKSIIQDLCVIGKYNVRENLIYDKIAKNQDERKRIRKILSKQNIDIAQLVQLINLYNNYSSPNNPKNKLSIDRIHFLLNKFDRVNTDNNNDILYNKDLHKLVSFWGDILTAPNKEELAKIISNNVLPPTSYKLKKKSSYSLDINAYVGIGVGYLSTFSNVIDTLISFKNNQFTYGISAPIGITNSWSFRRNIFINHFAISINPIDLGHLVNHYLLQPNTSYEGDVHFSEIFAPNFNLLLGIKNSPICIFLGGKFIPLRSPNGIKNSNTFEMYQLQAGLKFDLPLYNIFHRDR